MEKDPVSAATEITIAWLNLVGNDGMERFVGRNDSSQIRLICSFYREIYQTIREEMADPAPPLPQVSAPSDQEHVSH